MFRRRIVVCIVLGTLMSGCQVSTDEKVFMRFEAAREPVMRQVDYRGQYRLYAADIKEPEAGQLAPILEARLEKEDRVGFAGGADGQLLAVFGAKQTPLGVSHAGAYTWTMQPDPGQAEPARTVVLVVVVVAVAVTAVVAASAAAPAVAISVPLGL